MRLKDILKGVQVIETINSDEIDISGLEINSKKVKEGDLFIAIPGFKSDGHDFTGEAIKNGARALFLEKKIEMQSNLTAVLVKNCRAELPLVCRNFYKKPTEKLILAGVTGTNGKTTTVFLINSIFEAAGLKTSYITTVNARIAGENLSFERTTPESLELNQFFSKSIDSGVKAAAMEVSSHSIDLHRVDWLDFDFFIYTNLTQDHLDYHGTMRDYFNVKSKLFLKDSRKLFGGRGAVINVDDKYGKKIAGFTDLAKLTFSIYKNTSDIQAVNIKNSINGIEMDIFIHNRKFLKPHDRTFKLNVKSKLCGYFNVHNILASAGTGLLMGIDTGSIIRGISNMDGIKGRFEKIKIDKKINVIVDYAHTPDGLKNVLETARSLLPEGARLVSVFGCGGDRDTKKRKIMGNISAGIADFSFITSDNPRTEDPESIINMIEEGFIEMKCSNYKKEMDRKKAIISALDSAGENDIILIAGKGHENYQEFAGGRIYFSDQDIVREWSRS